MRLRLLALQDELRSCSTRGAFVLPDNIHLTLVFLGECDERKTDDVKQVLNKTRFDKFDIHVDSIGRFKRDSGDLWWAGVRENKYLFDLQQSLSDKLIRSGFDIDRKKYKPHITLARKVITKIVPNQIEPFGQNISRIDLIKSEHLGGVLTYTPIHWCST